MRPSYLWKIVALSLECGECACTTKCCQNYLGYDSFWCLSYLLANAVGRASFYSYLRFSSAAAKQTEMINKQDLTSINVLVQNRIPPLLLELCTQIFTRQKNSVPSPAMDCTLSLFSKPAHLFQFVPRWLQHKIATIPSFECPGYFLWWWIFYLQAQYKNLLIQAEMMELRTRVSRTFFLLKTF